MASTCAAYLQTEFGDLGTDLLDSIISLDGSQVYGPPHSSYIDTIRVEVTCKQNFRTAIRVSVAKALIWICEAIRIRKYGFFEFRIGARETAAVRITMPSKLRSGLGFGEGNLSQHRALGAFNRPSR